jgi:hypothetical protein
VLPDYHYDIPRFVQIFFGILRYFRLFPEYMMSTDIYSGKFGFFGVLRGLYTIWKFTSCKILQTVKILLTFLKLQKNPLC